MDAGERPQIRHEHAVVLLLGAGEVGEPAEPLRAEASKRGETHEQSAFEAFHRTPTAPERRKKKYRRTPRGKKRLRSVPYPLAEAEDAVDEDDGRRRAVEHDGRGARALVALPRGGDVDERPLARGGRQRPAQQEGPGGRGRLRDVGGHGRAEDVEAEGEVHRGAPRRRGPPARAGYK